MSSNNNVAFIACSSQDCRDQVPTAEQSLESVAVRLQGPVMLRDWVSRSQVGQRVLGGALIGETESELAGRVSGDTAHRCHIHSHGRLILYRTW